jgi:riboflavin kinase / FMN adenylyltransferase
MQATIHGRIETGAKRGRQLGFPTANISLDDQQLIDGIYITRAEVEGQSYQALTFIGTPEMFNDHTRRVETYLLDFDHDIYGKILTITLLKKIRESQPYESAEKLITEMQKDVEMARTYFNQQKD